MELNLERPLLFFDIESTGLNIASDSIIELCFVKIMPGNEQRVKTWRVKPWDYERECQRPINPSAQAVHGISAEELADKPTFCEIADEVVEWLAGSDLAGFNSAKFDLKAGSLMVSAQDLGFSIAAHETMQCQYDGNDLTIGFKSPFIIEILSNMNCGEIVMKFLDSKRAALIVPAEDEAESEKICGIIMPIMIS